MPFYLIKLELVGIVWHELSFIGIQKGMLREEFLQKVRLELDLKWWVGIGKAREIGEKKIEGRKEIRLERWGRWEKRSSPQAKQLVKTWKNKHILRHCEVYFSMINVCKGVKLNLDYWGGFMALIIGMIF